MVEVEEILKTKIDYQGFSARINYNGYYLTEKYKKFSNIIENLAVYDSDVWVTSFPKSGTTWTQEMAYLIASDLNYDGAKEQLNIRFPFLELSTLFDRPPIPKHELNEELRIWENTIKFVDEEYKASPRLIKTHLPWNLLPKSIRNYEKRPKIIHVTRNPKDVCVSYFFHNLRSLGFKGTFEEFCKLFLAGKVLLGPYWDIISSYWNQRNEPNVLFIKFEDMKSNLADVIEKVAQFLGKSVPKEELNNLIEHLNFDSMKANPAVNYESVNKTKYAFLRKGIVGDYKNHMSEEMEKQFDEWIVANDRHGIYKVF